MDLVKLKKRRTMWLAAAILFAVTGVGVISQDIKFAGANLIVSSIYVLVFIKSNSSIKKLEASKTEEAQEKKSA